LPQLGRNLQRLTKKHPFGTRAEGKDSSTVMIHGIFSRATTLLAASFLTTAALAQAPEGATSLGADGNWEAFTYKSEDTDVCYAFSKPVKSEASKKGIVRDPIYFMVTHWPAKKVKAQPSVMIGYTFKEKSSVSLKIEDKAFKLYGVDNMAWTDKEENERAILAAMKSGKDMQITGTSAKGTETTDTYSLKGISAALEKISSACK
jgi:hypothetical protein